MSDVEVIAFRGQREIEAEPALQPVRIAIDDLSPAVREALAQYGTAAVITALANMTATLAARTRCTNGTAALLSNLAEMLRAAPEAFVDGGKPS